MMCAIAASKKGAKVLLLEHNDRPLKKVEISGGGKCNFSNSEISNENYVSQNEKFCISALKQFASKDFIKILEKHCVKWEEREKKRLYALHAADVIDVLSAEAQNVRIECKTEIEKIVKTENGFAVNDAYVAPNLVVATGGISFPQIGASDLGYKIAKQFGLKIVPYKPALAPFVLSEDVLQKTKKLQGIALEAEIRGKNFLIRDDLLFTHFGLSGWAALQASLYWHKGEEMSVNLLPQKNIYAELVEARESGANKKIRTVLEKFMPAKLADFAVQEEDKFVKDASNKLLKKIAEKINCWKIAPTGTQGAKQAFATTGGVDVNEISSKTFECKKVPGLFFAGEVLDVTGQCGGYNLQWAWSSGATAGNYIGGNLK